MRKIILFLGVIAVAAGGAWWVWKNGGLAVSTPKVYQIGVVVRGRSYEPGVQGFLARMKELGYEEGKTVQYTIKYVDKKEDLPGAIQEMIKNGVDLIHTYSTPATIEAHKQTKTIPIVFGSMGDPLAAGVVQSLQKPGTNVTGIGSLSVDTAAKRVELLKELFPNARRFAFPYTPTDIAGKRSYDVAIEAAAKVGLALVPYEVTPQRSVQDTALAIRRPDVDGIVISADSAVWSALASYVAAAEKERLPFIVFDKNMVDSGGLIGYGPDYFAVGEQAAVLTHKILHGFSPADLPVETPAKFILAANLKTASAIGFAIPDSFLARVDYLVK